MDRTLAYRKAASNSRTMKTGRYVVQKIEVCCVARPKLSPTKWARQMQKKKLRRARSWSSHFYPLPHGVDLPCLDLIMAVVFIVIEGPNRAGVGSVDGLVKADCTRHMVDVESIEQLSLCRVSAPLGKTYKEKVAECLNRLYYYNISLFCSLTMCRELPYL